MKNAEDFRKAFGETEESFRYCVRQTLTELSGKEEIPMKKRISLGLVLAMVLLLMAAGAMAAGNWGIESFLEQQGKSHTEEMLELYGQEIIHYNDENKLVTMTVEEGLFEEELLYLAVAVKPVDKNTLVVPCPENTKTHRTDEITMNEAMNTNIYTDDMTVLDYAKERNFEHVVLHEIPSLYMNSALNAYDDVTKADAVAYALEDDGSLYMILQKRFAYQDEILVPDRTEQIIVSADSYKSDVKDEGAWSWGTGSFVTVSFDRFRTACSRRSIKTDAHDIVGYRGFIDSISITPYEDYAVVTIRLDKTQPESDQTWMSGPYWAVLDNEGNRLCYVDMKASHFVYDEQLDQPSKELCYGTIPLECMPEGNTFILQAENWNNYNIVYDQYTYTLE